MTLDPRSLAASTALLEDIEKATLRFVTQAIYSFRKDIVDIFQAEQDYAQDIGEDLTREALDRTGMSVIPQRLIGKVDFKRGRYLFLPDYSVRQALFVDSKAEKGSQVMRIQTDQTSMTIMLLSRQGTPIVEKGGLQATYASPEGDLLTTTAFVKYDYDVDSAMNQKQLRFIKVAALPHAYLQTIYNPSPTDTIWNIGPNSPKRGEPFRARLSLAKLAAKASWRVQVISADLKQSWTWKQ